MKLHIHGESWTDIMGRKAFAIVILFWKWKMTIQVNGSSVSHEQPDRLS